jgi:hypothetical protein
MLTIKYGGGSGARSSSSSPSRSNGHPKARRVPGQPPPAHRSIEVVRRDVQRLGSEERDPPQPRGRDSLSAWLTDANDDAGNARPAFIASKNVFLPEQKEIESLELYIGKYLWGGMQMTDKEKYPYAIYGIPNFKANRASADEGRNGQAHVWRIYDYPHIVMLYFRMYQIAKFYPSKVQAARRRRLPRARLSHRDRLLDGAERSGEVVGRRRRDDERGVHPRVDRRARSRRQDGWARELRGHWEGKVDRFVNRHAEPLRLRVRVRLHGFRVDRRLRALCEHAPDVRGGAGRREEVHRLPVVADMAIAAGSRRPTTRWGSDYRGNLSYLLSYMSQMGGWAILDYGLHFAADPTGLPASRLRVLAQFVGAGELGDEGERLRLLVPGPEQRRRDRRRLHAGAARAAPGSARR